MAKRPDAQQWYRACGRRDPQAWERLHGFLLALARKIALPLDEADRRDLVQNVLLEAWEAHAETDPRAWIPHTVMRLKSRVIDHHRRRTARKEVFDDQADPPPQRADTSAIDPERSLTLRQTLAALFAGARTGVGTRCGRLLDLYFRLKAGTDPTLKTIDHLAERIGITPNNASVSIHRCLKKLRAVPRIAEALEGVVGR